MIKLLPYYLYQIDAIESWLDDQAEEGPVPDRRSLPPDHGL